MAGRRQLVVFKVGAEEFAVDILLTKEVIVLREITPVPDTQEFVEGVMNLRGNLLPVIDLRKRLRARLTNAQPDQRIVIANIDDRVAGLIVDGASEVIRITDDMVEPAPDIISEMGAGYVEGIVNLKNRFITLIDLRKALSVDILSELDSVIEMLSRHRGLPAPASAR
ncbi:MAG TPA: chemotaxis protein CheW [Blastocatellia bacterium]|nr:chemotaxis protein CheW [Blastocatellia bacterium]